MVQSVAQRITVPNASSIFSHARFDRSQEGISCLTTSLKPRLLMPTVLQVGPYSFIFFSSDRGEPAHIHVKRDRQIAKFWLDSISLEKNRGFKEHELNQIARLVGEYQTVLLDAWHDYFDT